MSDREKRTCEERLPDHLRGRLADLRKLVDGIPLDTSDERPEAELSPDELSERQEEASEALADYGLGISTRLVVRVDLSTGGPADWFELEYDPDDLHEPQRVTYHFADWFDHAERVLDDDDAAIIGYAWSEVGDWAAQSLAQGWAPERYR